ncbi:MAG: transcriptional regulator [Planctomycetes bacterium]|nr:transcriptional regulator [Planctomycetota bacterium]
MHTVRLKLVTIVAEAVLRERVVRELRDAGARGYTLTTCEGEGSRGVRASQWEGGNLRIETIVEAAVAERILTGIADEFFENYAVIVWTQDVEVVRGGKYA